jgi:hypothetical protein
LSGDNQSRTGASSASTNMIGVTTMIVLLAIAL